MSERLKKWIALLLFLSLLAGFVLASSTLLRPREHHLGGVDWARFEKEPKDSVDVLFVGSSFCFCNVIPAKIYEDTGYTSYILGASEMPIALAWHYLNEGLRTQSPDVVAIEIGYLGAGNLTAFPEVKVGFMPYFSKNRFEAVFDCSDASYHKGLLFPLYSYHSRWTALTADDVRASLTRPVPDPLAGCGLSGTVEPQVRATPAPLSFESPMYGVNVGYLQRMARLCEQRGIALVLFTAPNCVPADAESSSRLAALAAVSDAVHYIDGNARFDEIGLDPATDYADRHHMNYTGATKFSAFLARYLEQFSSEITPKRRDDALWGERTAYYDALPASWEAAS